MLRKVREPGNKDIELIINYFLKADHDFLNHMGVDAEKLPDPNEWRRLLLEDLTRPTPEKQFYYLIWELENSPVGHSNINKIIYRKEAYMHLHLWNPENRGKGNGEYFIRECIPHYFKKFDLQYLFCEPYALNPAPNRILSKIGFEFEKKYETIPGWINFYQSVNRWILSKEKWLIVSAKAYKARRKN